MTSLPHPSRVSKEVSSVEDVRTLRVTLLDGFTVHRGGPAAEATVGDLPHGVQRLVAHLCLSGRPARTAIAGHLWPDVPEGHAHGSLRSALWRLHKNVPGLIECSGGVLSLAAGVSVDVQELTDWADWAVDPGTRIEDVAVPDVGLRGELLPGWYDDWVLLERERLRQLRLHTLEAVAIRLAAADRHGEALQAAYAAVRTEPLRESAHRTVVRVHLAEGNVAEAVRAYDLFHAMVAEELGVCPTEQMTRLVQEYHHAHRHGGVAARPEGHGSPEPGGPEDLRATGPRGTAARLGIVPDWMSSSTGQASRCPYSIPAPRSARAEDR